ncbi:ABC transporter ATP-binding protein [Proteinivorax tanatarense]|uniref:ABC transporter ATP-binding protein n=1 Tax=Proteinivorax tanatarense TaxID=1260629 RepID=A0AAU7VQU9_9FIRM
MTKRYSNYESFFALKPTSLTVDSGTINVIYGKSGSGKSTLLNILGGMDAPTQGKVMFENKDLYQLNDKEQSMIRGKRFGFVFQFFHLIPELSVYDNISLPTQFTKEPLEEKDIVTIAKTLGVEQRLTSLPSTLSGGEQQLVAVARALINHPDIIFADEPTGNLDSYNSSKVSELLETLCKERDVTLVLVTHDKDLIQSPDNLYQMEDGNLQLIRK